MMTWIVKTGSDSKNWHGGGARSVSPDSRGAELSRGAGHRGGRRGRGRGRWVAVNGGPRLAGGGLYQRGFGKLTFLCILCVKAICIK